VVEDKHPGSKDDFTAKDPDTPYAGVRVHLGADGMHPHLRHWTSSDGMIEFAHGYAATAKEAAEKAEAAYFA
jgi:hypothetical protein